MSGRLDAVSQATGRRAVTMAWLLIAPISGCASAYGGAEVLPTPYEAASLRGYSVRYFDVVAARTGVRLHGRICRDERAARPISNLRLEQLSASGTVVAVAEANLHGLRSSIGRTRSIPPCALFNADAPWRPTPGQSIRICSTDEARATAGGVCPEAAGP